VKDTPKKVERGWIERHAAVKAMRRFLLGVMAALFVWVAFLLPLWAQTGPSLEQQIKVRQQEETSALKAQHRLEREGFKGQGFSKTEQKRLNRMMKREERQLHSAHRGQWRDLKARRRWNKEHPHNPDTIPN
jgi:hypothetical protein